MREDSSVFLRSSRGQRSDPRRGLYGKFAAILQGEIRQRVSRVRMLMIVSCEGTMQSRLARDPWQNQHAKKHRMLSLEHHSDLRDAYCGITQKLLGWPTP